MKKTGSVKRCIQILLPVLILIGFILAWANRSDKLALLDRAAYEDLTAELEEKLESASFTDQESLLNFISSEASELGLEYSIDDAGNIIFTHPASGHKKKVSPTIIALEYNYETTDGFSPLLASALTIAGSDVESGGLRTVILFNNEGDEGKGFKGISSKLFTNKSKTIYLSRGSGASISRSSFSRCLSSVEIPARKVRRSCDTAVRISINGIRPSVIDDNISEQPDPFTALSSILTMLTSRSVNCQLADFAFAADGCMCPASLDITILINSYSADTFIAFLDKLIREWDKEYSDSHPEMEFTYTVDDGSLKLPRRVWDMETIRRLSSALYTIKRGEYNYTDDDSIPDGEEEGSISGENIMTGMTADDDSIVISMVSQAYDDIHLARITDDNRAAAGYSGCSCSIEEILPAFSNERDSLSRMLGMTYKRVNSITSIFKELHTDPVRHFTPCTYLSRINSRMDIVQLMMSPSKSALVTNMILCCIDTRGNFLHL